MGDAIALAVILLIVYVFVLFKSFSKYTEKIKLARLLRKVPTTKIADVVDGYIEIKGKLCDSQHLLSSPVSKVPCLYYEVLLEKKVTKCTGYGKNRSCSSYWITDLKLTKSSIVKAEDETGSILIDIPDATTNLITDFKDKVSFFDPAKEEMKTYMQQLGKDVDGIFKDTYRLKEAYLEPGDSIYAIGAACEINGELCIGKGKKDTEPFIVSDKSEQELNKEYRTSAILYLAAFIGLLSLPALPFLWIFGHRFYYYIHDLLLMHEII